MNDTDLDRILRDETHLELSPRFSSRAMEAVEAEWENGTMPRRQPLYHAWPAIAMASIVVALIIAGRALRNDSPGARIPEAVRWLGAAVGGTIALGRSTIRLLSER